AADLDEPERAAVPAVLHPEGDGRHALARRLAASQDLQRGEAPDAIRPGRGLGARRVGVLRGGDAGRALRLADDERAGAAVELELQRVRLVGAEGVEPPVHEAARGGGEVLDQRLLDQPEVSVRGEQVRPGRAGRRPHHELLRPGLRGEVPPGLQAESLGRGLEAELALSLRRDRAEVAGGHRRRGAIQQLLGDLVAQQLARGRPRTLASPRRSRDGCPASARAGGGTRPASGATPPSATTPPSGARSDGLVAMRTQTARLSASTSRVTSTWCEPSSQWTAFTSPRPSAATG